MILYSSRRLILFFDDRIWLSCAIIDFGGLVPTAISIFLGSGTGQSEKLATSIQSGPFYNFVCCTLWKHSFFGFSMRSMVRRPFQEVPTITENSVSSWIVNCFATPIFVCSCVLILDALCDSMLIILERFLFSKLIVCLAFYKSLSLCLKLILVLNVSAWLAVYREVFVDAEAYLCGGRWDIDC